ncbi:O-antigen biosynthesis glycosyltransferase WbnK [termite gut metagenome]|uniref:O-antigen biosynthesis glycosyltransferase WbnK n=1 Tax=termite gut metagenome TaxID=433724 RepID=A0A5J4SAU2_9ZZZZ
MFLIVRSSGGLANRMFQYSLYKNFEAKDFNVFLDDSYIARKWDFENVSLKDIFSNVEFRCPNKSQILKVCGGYDKFSTLWRHIPLIKNRICFFYKCRDGFDKYIFNNRNNKAYLIGTFQSEKFFEDIKNQIRHDFEFMPFADKRNNERKQRMIEENSVAIHVRKGLDYNKNIIKGCCNITFYHKAIEYIKTHVNNPKFYVFTDNIDWVKTNFQRFNLNYTLIDGNPISGYGNWIDMQLMSCAKHNIIANSTYSWWGAWLNSNPDKIVIAPLKWFNETYTLKNSRELEIVPNMWITL